MGGNHQTMKITGPALVRTAPAFMFKLKEPCSFSSFMNFRSSRKTSTVSGPREGMSVSVFRWTPNGAGVGQLSHSKYHFCPFGKALLGMSNLPLNPESYTAVEPRNLQNSGTTASITWLLLSLAFGDIDASTPVSIPADTCCHFLPRRLTLLCRPG